jgi:phospholipid-binding lipoprotein MlaA
MFSYLACVRKYLGGFALAALMVVASPVSVLSAELTSDDPVQVSQSEGVPVVLEQVAQADMSDANDPIEPVNRIIFEFNEFLQTLLFRPLAEIYTFILPSQARDVIRNFLTNLRSPVVLANDLLQGEGARAWETTQRMAINTTIGLGGMIDVADMWGIKKHSEDLGQTFAVWGAGEGMYLVLPVFGPSNPRDALGSFLDSYLDPVSYWTSNTDRDELSYTRQIVGGVGEYARVMDDLQTLKETSVDFYAAIRSISRQKRQADIRNGAPADVPLPDLKYDFNAGLTAN